MKKCLCGCGKGVTSPDKRGRERFYICGHQRKGKKKSYPARKCNHCEKTITPTKSMDRNKQFCNIRCMVAWRSKDPTVEARRLDAWRKSPKKTPFACLDRDAIRRRTESMMKRPDHQAFQECHTAAKEWRLRDPNRKTYIARNLVKFIRDHRHLFNSKSTIPSNPKTPWMTPAYAGLAKLNPKLKHPLGNYSGWTWFSDFEKEENKGRDMLGATGMEIRSQ